MLDANLTLDNACQLLCITDRFGQESIIEVIMSFMSIRNNRSRLDRSVELHTNAFR